MQKQRYFYFWHFSVCAEAIFCHKAMSNFLGWKNVITLSRQMQLLLHTWICWLRTSMKDFMSWKQWSSLLSWLNPCGRFICNINGNRNYVSYSKMKSWKLFFKIKGTMRCGCPRNVKRNTLARVVYFGKTKPDKFSVIFFGRMWGYSVVADLLRANKSATTDLLRANRNQLEITKRSDGD